MFQRRGIFVCPSRCWRLPITLYTRLLQLFHYQPPSFHLVFPLGVPGALINKILVKNKNLALFCASLFLSMSIGKGNRAFVISIDISRCHGALQASELQRLQGSKPACLDKQTPRKKERKSRSEKKIRKRKHAYIYKNITAVSQEKAATFSDHSVHV